MPQRPRNLRRFGTLLGALLLMMVVLPFFPESRTSLPVVSVLFSVLLIASVYAVSQRPRVLVVGLLLGAPTLVMEWITKTDAPVTVMVIDHVASIVFLSFVIGVLLTRLLRQQDVTTDTIYGGICVYLLAGVVWAYGYDLIETVVPGSFRFGEGPLPEGFSPLAQAERSRRFFFFSFVTLTTLGYGDTTPVASAARSLAILESICGVLFVGVLVARMAGMLRTVGREDDG